jgi:hypothetical protein
LGISLLDLSKAHTVFSIGCVSKLRALERVCCKLATRSSYRSLLHVSLMRISIGLLRLMQIEVKIAVIVVFTKYDMLFNEHFRKVKNAGRTPGSDVRAVSEGNAAADFKKHVEAFQSYVQVEVECVKVSTHRKYSRLCCSFTIKLSMILTKHRIPERFDMLKTLTTTTRKSLHDVEGDLWTPWAAAQQINAEQKVNFSIECVSQSVFYHPPTYQSLLQSAKASKVCISFSGSSLYRAHVRPRILG